MCLCFFFSYFITLQGLYSSLLHILLSFCESVHSSLEVVVCLPLFLLFLHILLSFFKSVHTYKKSPYPCLFFVVVFHVFQSFMFYLHFFDFSVILHFTCSFIHFSSKYIFHLYLSLHICFFLSVVHPPSPLSFIFLSTSLLHFLFLYFFLFKMPLFFLFCFTDAFTFLCDFLIPSTRTLTFSFSFSSFFQ